MKYVPYILIIVLLCVIIFDGGDTQIKEIHKTDTVTVFVTDTITESKPVYKTKTVVDTIYVEVGSESVALPREQKHYQNDGVYDAWISGYEPSLDSIRTYNKTEIRTVFHETTREIYKNKTNIYLNGGFLRLSGDIIPVMGVSITTKGRLQIGANLGIYKNSPTYMINVGYRINK